MAQGKGLNDDIADGGGFGWSGDDRALNGVGGELVQEHVLASTTDDVKLLDFSSEQCLELVESVSIEQSEAFEHAANRGAGILWNWLAGFAAEVSDFGRHVVWSHEAFLAGIDQ